MKNSAFLLMLLLGLSGCASFRGSQDQWEYMSFSVFDFHQAWTSKVEEHEESTHDDSFAEAIAHSDTLQETVVEELNKLGAKGWMVCSKDDGLYLLRRCK